MNEYSLSLEIYKECTSPVEKVVQAKILQKRKFIDGKYNSENAEKLLPKLHQEEEFLKDIEALMSMYQETIKETKKLLHKSLGKQITLEKVNGILMQESTDYMTKYYDLMLKK